MKLTSMMAVRPALIFVILAIAVLAPSMVVVPWWCNLTKHVEDTLHLETDNLHYAFKLGVDNIAKSLHYSTNSSAIYLAANLNNLSLKTNNISLPEIEMKVAPLLFQAISTIPKISQVSYIGINGVFYSYYSHNNQTFAVYSSNPDIWYTQQVNPLTGKPYGNITQSQTFISSNATWVQQALHRDNGFASLETDWTGSSQQLVLLNTVSVSGGNAVVSLGFQIGGLMEIFDGVHFNGGSLYLGSIDGKILLQGSDSTSVKVINGDFVSISTKMDNAEIRDGKVSCVDFKIRNSILNFGDRSYIFYCSKLQIAGLESVSVLAFPQDKLVNLVHRENRTALVLLVVITVAMAIYVLTFVVLMVRAAKREMKLCSALIKQMEATQQAERKSMNKSLAFASSSHDIRVLVAGIIGLIDISYLQVPSASELANNLKLMETCTKDLLDLLNSILDMSKIEAGKMQLEEDEFDVAKLVEDVVDLSHPIAARKGVDVMLDCGDGSINKFAYVKGDRGKLRQILSNLLSNAVKFTSQGHVLVRVSVKKPEENKIMSANHNGWIRFLALFFSKKNKKEINPARRNLHTMDYTFQVEDTGKGILKEKWKSVFENYVQVKETTNGQGGTGLGLGIVQSLVRLMGGEIEIVPKENGDPGTCFRFNVLLTFDSSSVSSAKEVDIEMGETSKPDNIQPTSSSIGPNLTIRTQNSIRSHLSPNPSASSRNSPRLAFMSPSPRVEGSLVVLLVQNKERGRIAHKFLESNGVKVSVLDQWEDLIPTLRKIKMNLKNLIRSSSRKSDLSSPRDPPLLASDGTCSRSNTIKCTKNFLLLVIDSCAGPFTELYNSVAEFREDVDVGCYAVIWLDKPTCSNMDLFESCMQSDEILMKPFHGSRLYEVLKMLPEFGGALPAKKHSSQRRMTPPDEKNALIKLSAQGNRPTMVSEIQEAGSSSRKSSKKLFVGKRFLVADDTEVMRILARQNLQSLGAMVEQCKDGKEAVELVHKRLQDQKDHSTCCNLPFDYILMDCEMPIMDGYEATREIRKIERDYGIRMSIIALTGHTSDEGGKMVKSGMDSRLEKPLTKEKLIEAIHQFNATSTGNEEP